MAEKIKVALLGAGNVGSQAARILVEDNAVLEKRIGAPVELIGIAVRDTNASRHWNADPSLYTTDAESLIDAADVVIELTGGIEPARTRILRALKAGKSVVSGNKALLAKHGVELQAAADESGAQLSYEAAVAGAIPILRPLRDSLAGDRVTRVLGIMNGTTNYILDQMDTTGASFADALAEAQKLGYAEADPTADVEATMPRRRLRLLLRWRSTLTSPSMMCTLRALPPSPLMMLLPRMLMVTSSSCLPFVSARVRTARTFA